MRTVGNRKERPITFSASADLLVEGARFNDDLHRLPTGDRTFMPKGVFYFKTHEEANQQKQEWLAAGMARIALERSKEKIMADGISNFDELSPDQQADILAALKRQGFNSFDEFFAWKEPILTRTYTAVVEKSADTGLFVGYIPGFRGAHTEAATLDELQKNLKEVTKMLLADGDPDMESEFVGTLSFVVNYP